MARRGELDLGFLIFNFCPQLRGTLTRGFLLTQRPLRTRREIKGFQVQRLRDTLTRAFAWITF